MPARLDDVHLFPAVAKQVLDLAAVLRVPSGEKMGWWHWSITGFHAAPTELGLAGGWRRAESRQWRGLPRGGGSGWTGLGCGGRPRSGPPSPPVAHASDTSRAPCSDQPRPYFPSTLRQAKTEAPPLRTLGLSAKAAPSYPQRGTVKRIKRTCRSSPSRRDRLATSRIAFARRRRAIHRTAIIAVTWLASLRRGRR